MASITASFVMPKAVAFKAQSKMSRTIAKVQLRSNAGAVFMRSQRAQPVRAVRMGVFASDDTLQAVREIISEQLGTDIEKVLP